MTRRDNHDNGKEARLLWMGSIDDMRETLVMFYKYSKVKDVLLPGDGVHRKSEEPKPRFVKYPNKTHGWRW